MQTFLRDMTHEGFLKIRKAFADHKAHKVTSLTERSELLWTEIYSEQYNFKKQELEVKELDSITLQDLNEFYEVTNSMSRANS